MQGTNGITRFTIQRAEGIDRLPISHTCLDPSTNVITADYQLINCTAVTPSTLLLGPTGLPVVVQSVSTRKCDTKYTITYESSGRNISYTVSADHRVTFQCGLSPSFTITSSAHHSYQAQISYITPDGTFQQREYTIDIVDGELEDNPETVCLFDAGDINQQQFVGTLSEPLHAVGHQTIRCGRDEIRQQIKMQFLANTPRYQYLLLGELGEIRARDLYNNFKTLQLGASESSHIWGCINTSVQSPKAPLSAPFSDIDSSPIPIQYSPNAVPHLQQKQNFIDSARILSVEKETGEFEVVSIEIDADKDADRRYTLQHAIITHNCFNTMDLPDYSSLEVMRTNMMVALKEGSQGFGKLSFNSTNR